MWAEVRGPRGTAAGESEQLTGSPEEETRHRPEEEDKAPTEPLHRAG